MDHLGQPGLHTASLTSREEDVELTHGISSRTSCSENKALEKKAGSEEAAQTWSPGPRWPMFILPLAVQGAGSRQERPLQGPESPK